MSEKKVIRIIPTSQKRALAAEKRKVVDKEQAEERSRKKAASQEEKERQRIARALKLHKSGKARALIETGQGQQQIEAASDEEIELEDTNALLEPEEDVCQPELPNEVVMDDGSTLGFPAATHKILEVLRCFSSYNHIGECVLSKHSGVLLSDPQNQYFKEVISKNILISTFECDEGGTLYKLEQRVHVENKADLVDLFRNRLPSGQVKTDGGLSAVAVSEEHLKGAYRGIECDIDRLVSEGVIDVLRAPSRDKRDIFFPSARGVSAPPSLRDLWHSINVPDEKTLRKALVDAKLRTEEEFEARDKRVKEGNIANARIAEEKKQQERQERKKPLVGKAIKHTTTTSIDDLF
jgi:hypothetical protein